METIDTYFQQVRTIKTNDISIYLYLCKYVYTLNDVDCSWYASQDLSTSILTILVVYKYEFIYQCLKCVEY